MSERVVLAPMAARTGPAGNTEPIAVQSAPSVAYFEVDAQSGTATAFLQLFVQTRIGDAWHDIARFSNIALADLPVQKVLKVVASADQSEMEPSLPVPSGSTHKYLGSEYRVRFDITASVTFAVYMLSEAR